MIGPSRKDSKELGVHRLFRMIVLLGLVSGCFFVFDCSGPSCRNSADCLSYLTCKDGKCVPKECENGTRDCVAFSCIDLNNNNFHCGRCGNACNIGRICIRGECESFCPAGQVECAGTCPNVMTDSEHCGRCFNQCGQRETCEEGKCKCFSNLDQCGSQCVDTFSHNGHCGACFKSCGKDQLCKEGKCVNRE